MSQQQEKPGISPAQLNITVGLSADAPTICSGGQIENFKKGWAVHIMPHSITGHYFIRSGFNVAVAACGYRGQVRWLYGMGNCTQCKRCQRIVAARAQAGVSV